MTRQQNNEKRLESNAKALIASLFLASPFMMAPSTVNAAVSLDDNEPVWGLGLNVRYAHVPFNTYSDTSSNIVPELYYNGDLLFLEGSEGGFKLLRKDQWSLDFLGRMRFGDLPSRVGHDIRMDTTDWGARLRYQINDSRRWYTAAMSDLHHATYLDVGHEWQIESQRFKTEPYIQLRIKDAGYNSYYYGGTSIGGDRLGAGIEATIGVDTRYHLAKGVYLVAGLEYTQLDSQARKSRYINSSYKAAANVGIMLMGDRATVTGDGLMPEGSYLRVAHGWATPSDMGEILNGKNDSQGFDDTLSSVFYGHPLMKNAFDLPLDFYMHSGVVLHHQSDTQKRGVEGVISMKAYYTLNWPIQWRIGLAEGLSYVSRATHVEKAELDRKESSENRLMNYLDISFDFNIGKLVGSRTLEDIWLGYSMHHRSSIFERSSHFGRIKGGSNYNTVYLQFDF